MEAFKPAAYNERRIIVSTNIAESSITIEGVVYIVDSMYHKTKIYDYKKGYECLVITPISK